MADDRPLSAPPAAAPAADDVPPTPQYDNDPYDALRHLVVGPEKGRIEALEARLDSLPLRAEELSEVLPEALRRNADDPVIAEVLEPLVARGFDRFMEAGKQRVVDALTPVMGALIRQWVSRELKARLAELSRVLEQGLSPRSLAWRVEAWRTNKSYGEVVLLRTLRYRVIRALLIHTETGILLRHVAADQPNESGAMGQAPDVVGAMLTAVQSYMHDGFGAEEGEAVDAIEIGDKTVWIENTPRAVLAVELAGLPDPAFRTAIGETMEAIEQRTFRDLVDFEGDVDAFAGVEPLLLTLMEQTPEAAPPRIWPGVLVVLALVVGLSVWGVISWMVESRFNAFLADLEAEPGIVITDVKQSGHFYEMRGLRDPMATDPDTIAGRHALSETDWTGEFEPYHATDPAFVITRTMQALTPPPTVELRLNEGTLSLTGTAPRDWWHHRQHVASALPGIGAVDSSGLTLTDDPLGRATLMLDPPQAVTLAMAGRTLVVSGEASRGWIESAQRRAPLIDGIDGVDAKAVVDELDASRGRVESVEIEFAPDVAELTAAGEEQLARTLDDMARLRTSRPWLRFVVVGHADASGSPQRNAELRKARADAVADRLLADQRLGGAVLRRPADPRRSAGRIARIRVEIPPPTRRDR